MKYDVHIFAVARVKVPNVKARSHTDAIKIAKRTVDLYRLFDFRPMASHALGCGASETEYTEELGTRLSYLVDQAGDTSYIRSRRFDEDRKEIPESSRRCRRTAHAVGATAH